jgi:hypothetical protein
MTQPTQRLDLSLTVNSDGSLDSSYPAGDKPLVSSGTLIASANFTDGSTQPSSIYTGANWSSFTHYGAATVTIDTAGGNSSIKGICPATDGITDGCVLGLDIPTLNISEVYIQFRAKFRGTPHAIKFCKVHGQVASGYANCTFGLSGGGAMTQTSFGDGSGTGNDTAQVINLNGTGHQLGRNSGAGVLTPQNSTFTQGMWGNDVWHDFKVHVKFNSGTSALNEVADGIFYVEIDGLVYVNATGLFNRHYTNLPIEYISFFDVAQDNDYGYELLYDDIKVSTGGFA